ncbi:UvrD-like helicase C-terminal domain-containing protein [Ruminococcaceae bacterium FB2012]|nr:UvrD-like helicase C-terminal domain-containing protein [Ruminococcaceae bacterium FB2012]
MITKIAKQIIIDDPAANIKVMSFNNNSAIDDEKKIDKALSQLDTSIISFDGFAIPDHIRNIVSYLMPKKNYHYDVSTIHAFAREICYSYGKDTELAFLTKECKEPNWDKLDIPFDTKIKMDDLRNWKMLHHSDYVRILVDKPYLIESYASSHKDVNDRLFADFVVNSLLESGLTYDDSIYFASYIVKTHPCYAKCMAPDYMIIDEFQDIDPYQLDLILTISQYCKQMIVVGDPSQNIYAFRNSMTTCFEVVKKYFNVMYESYSEINMKRSYRCPHQICECANLLMRDTPGYKDMYSTIFSQVPQYHIFDNDQDEFEYVYQQIKNLLNNGITKDSIIVLAYSNDMVKRFREYTNQNINISTIHRYKGAESDYVFVMGVQGDSFPSSSGIKSACYTATKLSYLKRTNDKKTLQLAKNVLEISDDLNNRELYDLLIKRVKSTIDTSKFSSERDLILAFMIHQSCLEQYRLLYVAITRTKKKLIITGHKKDKTVTVPSPLIAKMSKGINIIEHKKICAENGAITGEKEKISRMCGLSYIVPAETLNLSPDTIIISIKTTIDLALTGMKWTIKFSKAESGLTIRATINYNGIDFCYFPLTGILQATFHTCKLLYDNNAIEYSKNDASKLVDIVLGAFQDLTENYLIKPSDLKLKRADFAVMSQFNNDKEDEEQYIKLIKHCKNKNVACVEDGSLYMCKKQGCCNTLRDICKKDHYAVYYRKDEQQTFKYGQTSLKLPTRRLETRLQNNALISASGERYSLEDLFMSEGLMEKLYLECLCKIQLDLAYADLNTYRMVMDFLKSNITVKSRDRELDSINKLSKGNIKDLSPAFLQRAKKAINALGFHIDRIPHFRNYNHVKIKE